jgi:hypothetical protein
MGCREFERPYFCALCFNGVRNPLHHHKTSNRIGARLDLTFHDPTGQIMPLSNTECQPTDEIAVISPRLDQAMDSILN